MYTDPTCTARQINHAVNIIGWGSDYWIGKQKNEISIFVFIKPSLYNLDIFVYISQSAIPGVQAGEMAATSLSNWESICAILKNTSTQLPQTKLLFHNKSLLTKIENIFLPDYK